MSIENLLAQGYQSNIEPYGNALMRAQQFKMQQAQVQNALMQQQDMHAQRAQALQQAQAAAEQQRQRDAMLGGLQTGGQFDPVALLRAGVPKDQIEFLANRQNLGRPEVARETERAGANGRPEKVFFDKYGNPVGAAMPQAVKLDTMDLGGKRQVFDPYAAVPGQGFTKTQTPDSMAQVGATIRGQNMTDARAREGNAIQKDLLIQQGQLKVAEMQDKADARDRAKGGALATVDANISVIDKALKHPGRETATGKSGAIDPRNYIPGTDATDFRVVLDQIGGAAFLQAFENLKGGGQITEVEGKKATDAIARLNRAQSDKEFKQSLEDLRSVMVAGRQRLQGSSKAGKGPAVGSVVDGYRFKGGDPGDSASWEKQ